MKAQKDQTRDAVGVVLIFVITSAFIGAAVFIESEFLLVLPVALWFVPLALWIQSKVFPIAEHSKCHKQHTFHQAENQPELGVTSPQGFESNVAATCTDTLNV